MVTAKDKLRALLGRGLPLGSGTAVCFSAEKADQATLETNGIADGLGLVGMPVPPVYLAALSEFVLAAGVRLLESGPWDLMYLSTTDYIQHKHAPGTPVANAFYRMLDGYLARLDALGAALAVTSDHGMKPKHDAEGRPNIIYLQPLLDAWLGEDQARVILPITDPYVVHHGPRGSFAAIYLAPGTDAAQVQARLVATEGVMEVLSQEEACIRFGLPPHREGDLIVLSEPDQTLGGRPESHDLSQLQEPLRFYGGTSEQLGRRGARRSPESSGFPSRGARSPAGGSSPAPARRCPAR